MRKMYQTKPSRAHTQKKKIHTSPKMRNYSSLFGRPTRGYLYAQGTTYCGLLFGTTSRILSKITHRFPPPLFHVIFSLFLFCFVFLLLKKTKLKQLQSIRKTQKGKVMTFFVRLKRRRQPPVEPVGVAVVLSCFVKRHGGDPDK